MIKNIDNSKTENMVKIVWNNSYGELDSIITINNGYDYITKALIEMLTGKIVAQGDYFTVEEID